MKTLLLILFAILFFITTTTAQWVQTNGPYGGNITAIGEKNGFIFAGTLYSGVYKSNDYGDTWYPSYSGLNINTTIRGIFSIDNYIFLATSSGIYSSSDLGENWIEKNAGITNLQIYDIVVLGMNMFAATGDGVFLSTDYGNTWNQRNNGLTNLTTRALTVKGNRLFVGTVGDGIYYTDNNGTDWNQSNNGLGSMYLYDLETYNDILLAAEEFTGIYTSSDNGLNWIGRGNYGQYGKFASSDSTIYLAGWLQGVFKSTNGGVSWIEINNGLNNLLTLSIYYYNAKIFVGLQEGGVFLSTDYGSSWIEKNSGLAVSNVVTLYSDGIDLFAGTNKQGIFYSSDYGNNWMVINQGITFGAGGYPGISGIIKRDNKVMICTYGQGFLISTDNGLSWTTSNAGLSNMYNISMTANDLYLFVGSAEAGIFRSEDDGQNWVQMNNGLSNLYIESLHSSDSILFAGTDDGVFRSTNYGENWESMNTGIFPVGRVFALASNEEYTFASVSGYLFRSQDYGENWEQIGNSIGLPVSIRVIGSNIICGILFGEDLAVSNDNGETWHFINQGIIASAVWSISNNNLYLFAGTDIAGVWRINISEIITSVEQNPTQPTEFILGQNYPNPFNTATAIQFSIPQRGNIVLKVYDILGNEVSTLVNEEKAQGVYTINFDANNLASGLYLYRIQAGSFIDTKKMILLK